jgi:hypothetical protein
VTPPRSQDRALPENHAALLIVRLWWEAEAPTGLRARVLSRVGLQDDERVVVAADSSGILAAVDDWINDFLARHHNCPQR